MLNDDPQKLTSLTKSDIRFLDKVLLMREGYVLDFSNKTFAEFFEDEVRIDIDHERFFVSGSSKANRLRTFLRLSESRLAALVLKKLWDCLYALYTARGRAQEASEFKPEYFKIISKLEGDSPQSHSDAVELFSPNETLSELVLSIDRDIQAGNPSPALDRLHTYCMKKYAHLLDRHNVPYSKDEPLHSRAGKYVKHLRDSGFLGEMSMQIMKNTTAVFEKFNSVRNNQSLAHDNEILKQNEGQFIFESVVSALRFVKSIEKSHFEN